MNYDPLALQALAMQCAASRRDRVLVLSDRAPGCAPQFPRFDAPPTIERLSSLDEAATAEAYDCVIADSTSVPSRATVEALLRRVAPGGQLMVLSADRSPLDVLRIAWWGVGAGRRRTFWPRSLERLVTASAVPEVGGFMLDRGLERLRYIVPPGGLVPAGPGPGFRSWLLRHGGFHVRRRTVLVTAQSPNRVALADRAVQLLRGADASPRSAGNSHRVLQSRVSGTGVLMLRMQHGALGPMFIRVPLDDVSHRRVAHHYGMLQHVAALGFQRSPRAVGNGTANGFEFFAESEMPGVPRSVRLRQPVAARGIVSAALEALVELHMTSSRVVRLQDADFDRYFDGRLEAVRQSLLTRGMDDGPIRALGDHLRRSFVDPRAHVLVGVCHGDAWLPNHLFQGPSVSALIDWDMGSLEGICYFDVAALVSGALLEWAGCTVTQALQELPADREWADGCLAEYHTRTGTAFMDTRTMLLCHWLEHVARHQTFGRLTDRWFSLQVQPVIAILPHAIAARPSVDVRAPR